MLCVRYRMQPGISLSMNTMLSPCVLCRHLLPHRLEGLTVRKTWILSGTGTATDWTAAVAATYRLFVVHDGDDDDRDCAPWRGPHHCPPTTPGASGADYAIRQHGSWSAAVCGVDVHVIEICCGDGGAERALFTGGGELRTPSKTTGLFNK
jgi:hypothetical protein